MVEGFPHTHAVRCVIRPGLVAQEEGDHLVVLLSCQAQRCIAKIVHGVYIRSLVDEQGNHLLVALVARVVERGPAKLAGRARGGDATRVVGWVGWLASERAHKQTLGTPASRPLCCRALRYIDR